MTYEGRAKILDVGAAAKDSAIAEWYEMDPAIGSMVHKPLNNGEVWHLDKRACYALTQGDNLNFPNVINPLPIRDVSLVTRIDEDGYKVKTTLEQICINDEDICPTEQYGPAFIKRNENSRLYQAQMFRTCINSMKENARVRDYSVDLEQVRKLHLNTFAHSKVKGFMWLWCSHALPAGTRLRGKDASSACPHCGKTEDIRHMTYDCIVAAYIREIVFTEWWACTTDSKWVMQPFFEDAFLTRITALWQELLGPSITLPHTTFGKIGAMSYMAEMSHHQWLAKNIWVEFTSTIRARLNHIKAKASWWTYRDTVRLVPKTVAKKNLEDIVVEQSILLALLPDWEHPGSGRAVTLDKLSSLCHSDHKVHKGNRGYTLPPTYPTFDPNWKIWTTPKLMRVSTLDAPGRIVAVHPGYSSSFSGSAC
jgi:hypothetical protein